MKDLTKGNILKLLILFSLPLLAGNVFQQLYNVVDTKIVGEVLGDDALAAIGASSPLFSMIVGALLGLGNGFAIVVSKYYGAKDMKHMRQAVANALVLDLGIAAVVTTVAYFMIFKLLRLLQTPEEIIMVCVSYIRVIILFMIFSAMYNFCAAMLRALGDTIRPLIFLAGSIVVNVILDIVFVAYLHLGVQGAAYATVISQALSLVASVIYIIKKCPELHLKKEDFHFDGRMVWELLSQGFAMAFMLCFVSIGTVILQFAINGFGKSTITAHMIARKISEIGMLPFSTLGVAAATFTGQNFGAQKFDRIKKGILNAIVLSWVWATVVILSVYTIGPLLIRVISGTTTTFIVERALAYLRFDTPFYFILGVLLVLRNAMQGLGRKIIPLVASGIELAGKLAVSWLFAGMFGYNAVIASEPIIWVVCGALMIIAFFSDKRIRTKVTVSQELATEE